MWCCPNCGEQVDAGFDACWKCGTAEDGTLADDFQAEPGDPSVPDPGPELEPPKERAEDSGAIPAGLESERLMELCSAANGLEAYALCNALEEAAIRAWVVGEVLGNAAGSLPLGEPIAPRIWVRQSDAIRAREIIDQWFKGAGTEPIEWSENDGLPEWETSAEQEEGVLPSDERFRFLSQGFFIVGLTCILIGMVWAWGNWMTLSEFSATADGQRVDVDRGHWKTVPMPGGRDQPLGRLLFHSFSENAIYAYVVDHKVYYVNVNATKEVPDHILIHYDPHDPQRHLVGPIAPPWVVLVFAFGLGAFMMFVGYQFR